jgi:hypothetical protein
MEDVGILYGHLVYVSYVHLILLWPFDIFWPFDSLWPFFVYFMVIWYSFPVFGMFGPRKIWQPWGVAPRKSYQVQS